MLDTVKFKDIYTFTFVGMIGISEFVMVVIVAMREM
jgi:hypothetical protein